jgi:hypothetical protein
VIGPLRTATNSVSVLRPLLMPVTANQNWPDLGASGTKLPLPMRCTASTTLDDMMQPIRQAQSGLGQI